MKLEFCSEFDENEVAWQHIGHVPIMKPFQQGLRPSKAVLAIILLMEQGNFPIIKLHETTNQPLKESWNIHEAYIRCHISVVPTISVEAKSENAYSDPLPEPEVPDGERLGLPPYDEEVPI